MYLLYAPTEKFNTIPPKTAILTDEVLFTNNVAYCPKFFWKKHHLLQGCRDITPNWMKKLRAKRRLNRILIIAQGGFGDVMWSLPVIKQIRIQHPQAVILIATDERTQPIFAGVPYANACVSAEYWNLQNLIRMSDEVYDFGGIATFLKKEMRREPVEACFFHIEQPLPKTKEDMRPHLIITLDEGKQIEARLRKENISTEKDQIITIALESSTPNRNWLFSYTKLLTEALISQGKKVIWLSESKDYGNCYFFNCHCGYELQLTTENPPEAIIYQCPNCKRENRIKKFEHPNGLANFGGKTNIRESMAIIALSDVFIGPCSGLMVIATALKIPTVGLFGAFDPKRIGKYYDKFIPLWGKPKCAPCSDHWTECKEGHPSPCMKLITWEQVYLATKTLLEKYPRQPIEKRPIE
jgi:heptosyltransferase-1